jgi:hypothetical protein
LSRARNFSIRRAEKLGWLEFTDSPTWNPF